MKHTLVPVLSTVLRRSVFRSALTLSLVALGGLFAARSLAPPAKRVGPLPDGGFLLNSGWVLHPAGQQVPVDTFPMSAVPSANGKYLLVLNGGYNPPSVSVIEIDSKKEISRTPVPDGWLGLTLSPANDRVFVGGGSKGAVYELKFDANTGALVQGRTFSTLANGEKPSENTFIGDVAITPDAHILYAANLAGDSIAVINLQSGVLTDTWKCGRRPYRILVTPDARQFYVSSWADASIYQYDANSGKELGRTRVGPHPTDMLLLQKPAPTEAQGGSAFAARLFVTAGNTNNVYSFGVGDDHQLTELETINVSMSPLHPLGMTPSALAANKNGSQLYIVCSDANALAVADISGPRARVSGFVPTAWYPTAVQQLNDGTLAILNGKGLGSRANPDGPSPTRKNQPLYQGGPVTSPGYVAHIQTGTVSFVPAPSDDDLRAFTETAIRNSPYRDDVLYGPPANDQDAYFTRTADHPSPVQHILYVIKENRTYDQVLGDVAAGNGDKSLTLFGQQITPNQHQLAHDFILYDNFYENSDVSADGHNWANAAIAPDYTVRTWPSEYAHRKRNYDFEGTEAANSAPAGYLWDNALQAGLTVRNYGEWTTDLRHPPAEGRQTEKANDPALEGKYDPNYRGFDLTYPDVQRAREFIREWQQFEASGQAPNLMVLRLANDHTSGTKPGAWTPAALVADNDAALGQIVSAISRSKLWASTAIFVIEDDAQNGPDHVDSHRAPAYVISPYTRRGIVDSTLYNQTSILRTMELLLGLRPMTHFDAGATPMFSSFSRQPDLRPFDAIAPKVSTTETNPGNAPDAQESARMDFSAPDRVDDDRLTAVIWHAMKHTDPPAPTRSAFAR